jgi:spore maturation protein CgeB
MISPLPKIAGVRVLVIGSYAYSDSFEWHVTDSLRHLGCMVELFHSREIVSGPLNWAGKAITKLSNAFLREPERLSETRLLRKIKEFSPALVLVLLGNQISPKTIAQIRKAMKGPIVCWCQDQMTTLGRQFLIGSHYDAVFVKDRYMQDLFSRMIRSTEFHYLPEACNPRMHRPIELLEADRRIFGCDLMLAGTLYYYRQEILEVLADLDIKMWGYRPDWLVDRLPGRFMGRDVHGDDKVRAALAAKICLNTLHYAEVNGLNCRAFELAGCGGFQMITSTPSIQDHFEPDEEIVAFRSAGELVEKARHYLRHPEEAQTIAHRGRLRAHRDHTYEHRLNEIFRVALNQPSLRVR